MNNLKRQLNSANIPYTIYYYHGGKIVVSMRLDSGEYRYIWTEDDRLIVKPVGDDKIVKKSPEGCHYRQSEFEMFVLESVVYPRWQSQ